MTTQLARELRIQLEQYFAVQVSGRPSFNPEVKWLCEPEEIDKMILAKLKEAHMQGYKEGWHQSCLMDL